MASRELVRDPDAALRQELIAGLNGGNAHARFEDVVDKFPTKLRGEKAGLRQLQRDEVSKRLLA